MCVSLFYVIDTGLTGFQGPDYGRSRRAMKKSEGVIFRKSKVQVRLLFITAIPIPSPVQKKFEPNLPGGLAFLEECTFVPGYNTMRFLKNVHLYQVTIQSESCAIPFYPLATYY